MSQRVFLALSLSVLLATIFSIPAMAAGPCVLRVGVYHGISGQFQTIQAAVDAARPGDWILIGPGDYREQGSAEAGVLVTTPGLHIRGMDRNQVILDGTRPGSVACSSDPARQDFGLNGAGRNGIEVLKVNGVSVENLTVCNFLSSNSGDNGNEIWFNGGDGSGTIGLGAFRAAYLTTSSTYYKDNNSAQAQYGIFASNVSGPGLIDHTYASNMGDSSYYVGACSDCNVVLTHAHAQNSALGYSGTNSGGHLIIEDSEWDHNKAGIVPNSLNNEDWPSPQNGACPGDDIGPTGTHSCTIIRDNHVHDNNNPNVPQFGVAGAAPVGTGIELAGGQNDTVIDNEVSHQGLWGILIHDLPDSETPPANDTSPCSGGIQHGPICYFSGFGNEIVGNHLKDNGFFGNVTNVDLVDGHVAHNPGNCWHGNRDPAGVTGAPANIQTVLGTCGVANQGDPTVQAEVLCIGFGDPQSCAALPPLHFPTETAPVLMPIPQESTMANPCAGVPANPWCEQSNRTGQVPLSARSPGVPMGVRSAPLAEIRHD